jgi:hypothetical protein
VRGICRTFGGAKTKKAPALAGKMLGMVAKAPEGLAGLRDRALLLVGFAGAFRRSELVALHVADVAENETGLLVRIRSSKTDQEGEGVTIAIARGDLACPVKALRAWLDAAGIEAGPIPADRQGGDGTALAAYVPVCRQFRQGVCRPCWFRCQHLFGAFIAFGVPNFCRWQRGEHIQNDGRVAPQVGGYLYRHKVCLGARHRCRNT